MAPTWLNMSPWHAMAAPLMGKMSAGGSATRIRVRGSPLWDMSFPGRDGTRAWHTSRVVRVTRGPFRRFPFFGAKYTYIYIYIYVYTYIYREREREKLA